MEKETNEETLSKRVDIIRMEKMCNIHKALSIAKEVEEVIKEMMEGNRMFTYVTRSGDRRRVRGTLKNYQICFGKEYNDKKVNHFIPYYDIDNRKWCTFHISSIIL